MSSDSLTYMRRVAGPQLTTYVNEKFKIYAAARCDGAEKDLVAFYPGALETVGEAL